MRKKIQYLKSTIQQKVPERYLKKRFLMVASSGILLLLLLIYGYYSNRFMSTDDAYINADIVQMGTRISGQVSQLNVVNNQFVKKGQSILILDTKPFEVAIDKASAQLAIDQANLQNAQITADRVLSLVQKKALPSQSADDALAKLHSATAAVNLARANLAEAKLNLEYAFLNAPTDGWITNMTTRIGANVNAQQPLFALISNEEFWVDANYKETELEKIHPGQTASIEVDMYPRHAFKGVVESISGGTGAAFSLLPPQNATGNWVKITQRIPVRIRIINSDKNYPLRIGATATVTVDTHSSNKK